MRELEGKIVGVIGLGKSGFWAARLLRACGAHVLVSDIADDEALRKTAQELEAEGIQVELGSHEGVCKKDVDFLVLSPGVSEEAPPVRYAKGIGKPVYSELEVAFWFVQGKSKIVAITGTNGKTTTTRIVGQILEKAGLNAMVCGNIGEPLSQFIFNGDEVEIFVLEVSSFQLEKIESFKPDVGAVLNLTQNHLDRHKSMEEYRVAKERIFQNQGGEDVMVLNRDDPVVVNMRGAGRRVYFSLLGEVEEGAFLKGESLCVKKGKEIVPIVNKDELVLKGEHNVGNFLAAFAVCNQFGVPADVMREVAKRFSPLEHRLEFVGEIGGVEFYNDSKATTVAATAAALKSFTKPVVLIMGGRDKGSDFGVLKDLVRKYVKHLVLVGEAKGKIRKALEGVVSLSEAENFEDAVRHAYAAAHAGEIVLLSPACASFDMFTGYEERGRRFKEIVGQLSREVDEVG